VKDILFSLGRISRPLELSVSNRLYPVRSPGLLTYSIMDDRARRPLEGAPKLISPEGPRGRIILHFGVGHLTRLDLAKKW